MFDSFELEILNTVFEAIKNNQETLSRLNKYIGRGLGIEGWFLVELLTYPKFQKWGIEKVQSPADLKIKKKH